MNLLDTLQAASNTAASNVSGPVDLIAWTLRKLGLPIPAAPFGSSDWMAQKGLTRPVEQGASQVVGDTIGLLSPAVVQQAAPKIAAGLLKAADNAAAPRTLNPQTGAIVWHGSPHKFDKFDSSKIGTGEGAQAYGHGLYLAESPDVAKSYQATLSGRGDAAGAAARFVPARQFNTEEIAAIHRAATGDDPISLAARRLGYRQASLRDVDEAALTKAIADVREQAAGALYKVDLPDEKIARMLDWDAPLSQQAPEVRGALDAAGLLRSANPRAAESSGAGIYRRAQDRVSPASSDFDFVSRESQLAASALFRRAGIPGIKYLDGGSRGAGTGTRNFVVFPGEEEILKILERNGIPLIP